MKSELPKRVHEKHGAYYFVAKNKWTRLCRVRDGLPDMYRALAELTSDDVLTDTLPRLVDKWLKEVSVRHAKKTQANDSYMCRTIKNAFSEFSANQVKPPHVIAFLTPFQDKPRSYNGYRSQIRELMRFAEEMG